MDDKLKASLDDYIREFLNQEHVKKYFALEKRINEDKMITAMQNKLKETQKALALSLNDNAKHEVLKKEFLTLKAEFDNHPLINNYNVLKEEIYQELKELERKLKS